MDVISSKVDISVSSVDAYQGREADAVIFSATRNNAHGKIGFLKDARRLNVTITRPRRALVVIAAPRMLHGDANWAKCVLALCCTWISSVVLNRFAQDRYFCCCQLSMVPIYLRQYK